MRAPHISALTINISLQK